MTPPANILVVGDNPVARAKSAQTLREAGHDVAEAGCADDCLRAIQSHPPDLVLVAARQADHEAVGLCRHIKSLPEAGGVLVVMLSSNEVSADQQAAGLEAGADGYIAWPTGERELLARVESLLRIQRADEGLRSAQSELERQVEQRTLELSRANAALRNEIKERLLAEEAQRRLMDRLEILHAVDEAILSIQTPESIAEKVLSHIRSLLPCEQASVWEINDETGTVTLLARYGADGTRRGDVTRFSPEQLRLSRAFRSSQPVRVQEATNLFDPLDGSSGNKV